MLQCNLKNSVSLRINSLNGRRHTCDSVINLLYSAVFFHHKQFKNKLGVVYYCTSFATTVILVSINITMLEEIGIMPIDVHWQEH